MISLFIPALLVLAQAAPRAQADLRDAVSPQIADADRWRQVDAGLRRIAELSRDNRAAEIESVVRSLSHDFPEILREAQIDSVAAVLNGGRDFERQAAYVLIADWKRAIASSSGPDNLIAAWCLSVCGRDADAAEIYRRRRAQAGPETYSAENTRFEQAVLHQRRPFQWDREVNFIQLQVLNSFPTPHSEGQIRLRQRLEAMTRLTALLENSPLALQREILYREILSIVEAIGDRKLAAAWIRKRNNEPWSPSYDPCAPIFRRAFAAYERNDLEEAEHLFQEVATIGAARSPSYGPALFNLGLLRKNRGDYAGAITMFKKVIQSDVDNQKPTGDIMNAWSNEWHYAALQIADCHGHRGERWEEVQWTYWARDRFPLRTFCATCANSSRKELDRKLESLRFQVVPVQGLK